LRVEAECEKSFPPLEEGTMCYSKYWLSEDERRQREAKAKEAESKRAETIKAMRREAGGTRSVHDTSEYPSEIAGSPW
jgi:hypothetical protein